MTRKVVITGIDGFVGRHVANTFISDGFTVIGVGHRQSITSSDKNIEMKYISCNLLDMEDVSQIDLAGVDVIIHLAGLSNVGDSFNKPLTYITDNASLTYNLLLHAQSQNFKGRIIVVSSGSLYNPNYPLPLTELSPTLENSPYAVGKLAAEHVSNYFALRGLDVVTVRPFNHIGPGQNKGFLVPDLYMQLKETQDKKLSTISVGNLFTRRDYTDVRDIARAYKLLALADHLNYSLYNICTGRSLSGTDILHLLQAKLDITHISPQVDQSKVRPTDIMDIYGDYTRIKEDTGWMPQIPLEQTIADFVESKDS